MKKLLTTIVFILVFLTGIISWRYFFFPDLVHETGWQHHLDFSYVATFTHFFFGPVALMTGVFQFLPSIRFKFKLFHKVTGLVYIISCVLGGISGLLLAINSNSGKIAAWGFGLLAVAWIYTTLTGFLSIYLKRVSLHREWMIRSYALTLAGVTLRLYLAIAQAFGHDIYVIIAWLCWVPNIIIAELYIRLKLK